MRERARDKGRLEDIIEYSTNVTNLIEGYSLETLIADKRTYYSVMKNIEVVGEAAYMLTKAFKKSHPEIPWKVVQGMRHVLVHDYANVVSATLYDTAVNDMQPLRQQVERYLAETDWDEWQSLPDEFDDANKEDIVKAARKMKVKGYAVQDISEITGLTAEEIEAL
ncbi:MAG: DUF86 domain-containing protein [Prevotella sp.]|nr:DUF86 domain-containing protein [Prevotella sp.]MBR1462200.1 DUF86 domain-containing protein [Prevotella sp.]